MVDDDLDLTAAALRRYGTKLYVLGDVTVSADCIAALGKLEFFHASGTVTLPQEAEETFCAIPDLAYDELRVLSGHLFSGLPKLTLTPDLLAQYPEGIACVDCAMDPGSTRPFCRMRLRSTASSTAARWSSAPKSSRTPWPPFPAMWRRFTPARRTAR